jgi:copper chaperone CopZ
MSDDPLSTRRPCYDFGMTTVEILFRYALHPTEAAMSALGSLREVYGIRRVTVKEQEQTIRVEYDATRLSAAVVEKLLRGAGIAIAEEVPLIAPPAAAVAAATPAAPAK